jgi:hypothetical protein
MLPPGSTDMPAAMLIQGIVKDYKDLGSFFNQRLHQDSEQASRDHVNAPLTLSQESVDRGEVSGLVQVHCQNDLGYGVLPNREHPSDNERYEDTKTGSAEAHAETKLVNPKLICYVTFHFGVPPSRSVFAKTAYARNAEVFQAESEAINWQALQKVRNYRWSLWSEKKARPVSADAIPIRSQIGRTSMLSLNCGKRMFLAEDRDVPNICIKKQQPVLSWPRRSD